MNTKLPLSVGQPSEVLQELPASVPEIGQGGLTIFLAVGLVINIVMVTTYFIWAYKQWSKTGSNRKGQQK